MASNFYFDEIRSILNGEKSAKQWKSLVQHLSYTFDGVYAEEFEKSSAAAKKKAQRELIPYVAQELDAHWPSELRVVETHHHAVIQELGRVLSISFFGSGMQYFGECVGKKYKSTYPSKKMIRELLPHWIRAEHEQFEGLIVEYLDRCHVFLVEHLLKDHFKNLRYVRFSNLSPTLARKPTHHFVESDLSDMVNRLIDLRGDTLEAIGCDYSGSNKYDEAFYGPIVERAEELPNLRWLIFGQPELFESDYALQILSDPAFDRIDTLTFTEDITEARATALIERAASKNLKRIGVGYFKYFSGGGGGARRMIDSENLANVDTWDLCTGSRDGEQWDTEEVARWRDYKRGVTRDELHRSVVDLHKMDAAQTREALFRDDALIPSEDIRALRVNAIRNGDLLHLMDHALEAWPNLECLVFQFGMFGDSDAAAWFEKWNDSPLLDRLKFLDWDDFSNPFRDRIQPLYNDKERQLDVRFEILEEILGGTYHPFLAYRAWKVVEDSLSRKPDRNKIAKRLGLSGYSKLDRYELLKRCEDVIIEALGGREKLLLDGPTYARHDWTDEFEWTS